MFQTVAISFKCGSETKRNILVSDSFYLQVLVLIRKFRTKVNLWDLEEFCFFDWKASFNDIDFANINIKNKKATIKNDIITLFSDEKYKKTQKTLLFRF